MTEPCKYNVLQVPKYVGGYQIGGPIGLRINLVKKPIWFHRQMVKLVLGWEWVDEPS